MGHVDNLGDGDQIVDRLLEGESSVSAIIYHSQRYYLK